MGVVTCLTVNFQYAIYRVWLHQANIAVPALMNNQPSSIRAAGRTCRLIVFEKVQVSLTVHSREFHINSPIRVIPETQLGALSQSKAYSFQKLYENESNLTKPLYP